MAPFRTREYLSVGRRPEKAILHGFDRVTKSGQMLLVLGRPGSGCPTFLETVLGELHGLKAHEDSELTYNGTVATTSMDRDLLLIVEKAFPRRR